MPFFIVSEDITEMDVDAVVNAANTDLRMGSGVCGAIFHAAGIEQMEEACARLRPVNTGEAVITPGFNLPARYVIHTPGPVYQENKAAWCEERLRASYRNSLNLAASHHCESVAFPLISSGAYGYPKEDALQVAVSAIREFLEVHELTVYLTLLTEVAMIPMWDQMDIRRYLTEQYTGEALGMYQGAADAALPDMDFSPGKCALPEIGSPDIAGPEIFQEQLDEPFNKALLHLIDAKGKTDVEVYKKANISRKLFSKIRTGRGYMPGKRTILALAIGLELSVEETENLLEHAGFALSSSILSDVIVKYFISHKKYDIYEINDALFQYGQPLLGSA